MSALLAQAQQMQQQLMEAQEALANSEVHGQAGGGLVQITMKGSGEVVAASIDPKVVDPSDVETLQDLIVGAIADASKQVTILAHDRLGPLAGGVGDLGIGVEPENVVVATQPGVVHPLQILIVWSGRAIVDSSWAQSGADYLDARVGGFHGCIC